VLVLLILLIHCVPEYFSDVLKYYLTRYGPRPSNRLRKMKG
jgi:hypothetical protein